jgi:hypothetical protein
VFLSGYQSFGTAPLSGNKLNLQCYGEKAAFQKVILQGWLTPLKPEAVAISTFGCNQE